MPKKFDEIGHCAPVNVSALLHDISTSKNTFQYLKIVEKQLPKVTKKQVVAWAFSDKLPRLSLFNTSDFPVHFLHFVCFTRHLKIHRCRIRDQSKLLKCENAMHNLECKCSFTDLRLIYAQGLNGYNVKHKTRICNFLTIFAEKNFIQRFVVLIGPNQRNLKLVSGLQLNLQFSLTFRKVGHFYDYVAAQIAKIYG